MAYFFANQEVFFNIALFNQLLITMKDQLIEIYEAEVKALREELAMTRQYIYRDYEAKGVGNDTCQDLINQFIKIHKVWFTQGSKSRNGLMKTMHLQYGICSLTKALRPKQRM